MIHSRAFPCGLREFNTLRDANCALQLGGQPHIGSTRACFHHVAVFRLTNRAGIMPAQSRLALTAAATATATSAQPEQDADVYIARSLEQLQYCVANLDTDLSADGLLTAYQQLQHVQRQLLQELRSCQAAIHRSRWRVAANSRRSSRGSSRGNSNAASATASLQEEEQVASSQQQQHCLQDSDETAQLAQLRQLRLKCDDAQDYLVGLMQAYLQVEPAASATRLLTLAASRQLNIAALNRTCVQAFLDKQRESTLTDMTGLMAALALVRCCSKHRQQVEGLEQHELAALFSGIMTHLLAYVERTMSNQQQQQQQQQQQPAAVQANTSCGSNTNTSRSRTRRAAAAAPRCSVTLTQPATAQQHEVSAKSAEELRRQVAAGVAAHVSGRVPLASALIPHILQILGDTSPGWLHPITDLQAATTVSQLQSMILHPGRYDYTYLATALHRLSELTEQQQQLAAAAAAADDTLDTATAAVAAARAELAHSNRLARKLYGRLQQLAQDATATELACVLQATCRLGTAAGEVYAVPALQFAQGPQLQQATETQIASVMYSVAVYSSSSVNGSFSGSSTGSGRSGNAGVAVGFTKQQQQVVLKACAQHMCNLLQQQQQQQIQTASEQSARAAAAALIEPSTALMAVWALATSNVQIPKAITRRLFEYIGQSSSLQRLIGTPGSSSSSKAVQQQQESWQCSWEEVARNSCTILWAAAQLQYEQADMALVRACLSGFMQAMPAVHVACSNITIVLQSLALLLAAQQRQQQQQQASTSQQASSRVAPPLQQQQLRKSGVLESDYWKSIFLRCTDEFVHRLLGQQQQQQQSCTGAAAAAAAAAGSTAAIVDSVCPITAACQVVWAYQVAGYTLPDKHVAPLVQLLGNQVPPWLLGTAFSQAKSATALLELLQSPAAAAADLSCIATALQRLLQLQEQAVQALHPQLQAAVDMKEHDKLVKKCCQQISILVAQLPALQQEQQQQQQGFSMQQQQDTAISQPAAVGAQAAAAATVMWATAQLQHKDSLLSGGCLRIFHAAAKAAASAADAAAVVAAMASPGRLLQKVFAGCSIAMLQEVLHFCTAKLLSTGTKAVQAEQAVHHGGSSSTAKMRRRPNTNTSSNAQVTRQELPAERQSFILVPGSGQSVLLAQQLLQLHAVLRLQPTSQQLQQLLQAATDEASLSSMDGKAAAAALVAVLAAVAELSTLQQSSTTTAPAVAPAGAGKARKGQTARTSSSLQEPFQQRTQHLQVQQLLQDLLLYGLLPRMRRATAKQIVTSLEAVAALTARSSTSAGIPAGTIAAAAATAPAGLCTAQPLLCIELSLARDFARGVLQEIMATSNAAAAAAHTDEDVRSFLSGWKGEHVATVATAALKLGVPCSSFFEAVAADVLKEPAPAATTAAAAAAAAAAVDGAGSNQTQRRRSLIEKLQPQHLVVVCCCAAALHCRIEQLLVYTFNLLSQQLQQQQGKEHQQQQEQASQRRQQQQPDPVQLLLLAWSAAAMDVPQLLQPAQMLATAGIADVRAAASSGSSRAVRANDKTESSTGARWLQLPAVAARLFQLHIWLSDRQLHLQLQQEQQQQQASAAVSGDAANSDSSSSSGSAVTSTTASQATAQLGLTGALAGEELQLASSIWSWLQLEALGGAYKQQLEAVAAALQQLPGVEQLQLQSTTPDGWLILDLEARVRAIPVVCLVLDDCDDDNIHANGSDRIMERQQHRGLAAAAPAAAAAGASARPSSSSGNSSSVLLKCLGKAQIGDVMFRARALAARGYWVVVISRQQWIELEGQSDAELQYLLGKLWLLHDEVQGVEFAEGLEVQIEEGEYSGGEPRGFVTGMPVTAATTASFAEEEGFSEKSSISSPSSSAS